MARKWTELYEFLQPQWLPLAKYDPTTNAGYPKGRFGFITSDGVFRSVLHLDNSDSLIMAADFAAISKNLYFETNTVILNASPSQQWANTTPASLPTYEVDCTTNLFRVLYSQQGSPSQAQHEALEISASADSQYFHLFNFGVAKGIGIRSGTAGNRGVIKTYDATAAAYKYAYIDNGAWVIAASEPT